jgi:bifunctional non-homologous end joining protein LigD
LTLNGENVRALPLEDRRARLRKALRGGGKTLRFSEHLEGDGPEIYRRACALGLEGIVVKRDDSRYPIGALPDVLKVRNPDYERR